MMQQEKETNQAKKRRVMTQTLLSGDELRMISPQAANPETTAAASSSSSEATDLLRNMSMDEFLRASRIHTNNKRREELEKYKKKLADDTLLLEQKMKECECKYGSFEELGKKIREFREELEKYKDYKVELETRADDIEVYKD